MFGTGFDGKKNRRAFLDTLFEALEKGQIDMEGVAEEVDTFMFEGFFSNYFCNFFSKNFFNYLTSRFPLPHFGLCEEILRDWEIVECRG